MDQTTALTILPNNADSTLLYLSPDNKFLVSQGHNSLRLWDLSSGSLVKEFADDSYYIQIAALSPDGHYLLGAEDTAGQGASARLPVVILWDVVSGKRLSVEDDPYGGVAAAAFSPDSTALALSHNDSTLTVLDINS
jgi:WD40 repeat protein